MGAIALGRIEMRNMIIVATVVAVGVMAVSHLRPGVPFADTAEAASDTFTEAGSAAICAGWATRIALRAHSAYEPSFGEGVFVRSDLPEGATVQMWEMEGNACTDHTGEVPQMAGIRRFWSLSSSPCATQYEVYELQGTGYFITLSYEPDRASLGPEFLHPYCG